MGAVVMAVLRAVVEMGAVETAGAVMVEGGMEVVRVGAVRA